MIHLNGHLLCAIDTETTGLKPFHHEIWEISILPLDENLDISQKIVPFNVYIQPTWPERADPDAIRVNKEGYMKACTDGFDKYVAAELFEEWFNKLKLGERKRIAPLGHNWAFDRAFMQDWLGHESFDFYVDGRFRDTMAMANYENDRADWKAEPHPFPKLSLSYVASQLKIDFDKIHNALDDTVLVAKVYKDLVRGRLP